MSINLFYVANRCFFQPGVRDEMLTPVSRILFYAIISLGTYQTIDALLTGSGLFGLHPPRSWRYASLAAGSLPR